MRPLLLVSILIISIVGHPAESRAHDIPNARVDRATQIVIEPGLLKIDYEVGLSELTLTQELRSLIGKLPGSGPEDWYRAYGEETGILNARGFLVAVNGLPVDLAVKGFDLTVQEHPRYTFHFEAPIPKLGRVSVHDTNFLTSQGISKLAVKGFGTTLEGNDLPSDVSQIPEKPLWQMTDDEESRSRSITLNYETKPISEPAIHVVTQDKPRTSNRNPTIALNSLSRLLSETNRNSFAVLAFLAFVFGALHALQPGHGKTLVAISSVDGRSSGFGRGALVALIATLTHVSSILLIAALLWYSGTSRFSEIHQVLLRSAGFVVAAIGFWRLGAVFGPEPANHEPLASGRVDRGVAGLGMAAGIIPCWDAVGLLMIAGALDRLPLGILLTLVFSLGMGTVLVILGGLAGRLRDWLKTSGGSLRFDFWSRLLSGLVLSAMGMYLLGLSEF